MICTDFEDDIIKYQTIYHGNEILIYIAKTL